jgi:probable phosphoglycerate mutase
MATTELVLVCHGEAAVDLAGLVDGPGGCSGLTARGQQQAQLVAGRLAGPHARTPFVVCYTSPCRCARQTAQIIGAVLQLAPHAEDRIRGPHPGDADGQPRTAVEQAFGGPPQARPDHALAPGAETWHQYLRRATTCLGELHRRHRGGGRVLIVGHRETVAACHVWLLGLPADLRAGLRFRTDPTGITRWRKHYDLFGSPVWTLLCHNDTGHLRGSAPP